jgi:hypothetical protein
LLLPILTPIISAIANFALYLSNLDGVSKGIILTILGVVAVAGPLLLVFVGVMSMIQKFQVAMAVAKTITASFNTTLWATMAPFLAVIAVIAILVGAFIWAWNNVDGFKEGVMSAIQKVKDFVLNIFNNYLIPAFNAVSKVISDVWNVVVTKTKEVFEKYFVPFFRDQLVPIFKAVWDTIVLAVQWAFNLIQALYENVLKPIFTGLVWYFQNVLLPVWTVIFDAIASCVKFAFGVIGNLWDKTLKPILTGVITFLQGVFKGDWKKIWEGLGKIVGGVFEGMKTMAKAPINFIITGLNAFIRGINKIKIPSWVPLVGGLSLNLPEIPKLAVGTNYMPRDMVVQAHKGEAIIPADQNPANNGWGGQGQPQVIEIHFGSHIYRRIIDGINDEQRYAGRTLIDL